MFIHDITIGGYIPGNSCIHRLDPRTKLAGFVMMMAAIFISRNEEAVVLNGLAVTALVLLAGTGWKIWFLGLKRFSWMLAIAAAVNMMFSSGTKPLIFLGWDLPLSQEALEVSLVFTAQLAEAIVLSMALTFTTSPAQLTRGLERLARPLKRFSIPVDEWSMVVLLAMRFVPMLQLELRTTIEAQASRGVEFSKGTIRSRSQNLVAVLVPALMGALRRADLLASAMNARGFRPGAPRTEFKPLQFTRLDYAAVILPVLFLVFHLSMTG